MQHHRWILMAAGCLWLGSADAQMCKWTDEEGTVHYAEECPEDTEAESVTLDAAPAGGGDDPYAASRAERERAAASSAQAGNPGTNRQKTSKLSCEEARERLLAPERERLIKQCKAAGEKSDAECQRFYANHGDGGWRGGKRHPRKYDNIPECRAERG